MEAISVFDIIKIGVGPSSSHTMGPWRATHRALEEVRKVGLYDQIAGVDVYLYGSLAKTGRGHGTDIAVQLGLRGEDPATCDIATLPDRIAAIDAAKHIVLAGGRSVPFDPDRDIHFCYQQTLDFHPNGMTVEFTLLDGTRVTSTWFSVGGGFVVKEGEETVADTSVRLPHPSSDAAQLLHHCQQQGLSIADLVWQNELVWRRPDAIRSELQRIWYAMRQCVYRGCHTSGQLPGGLKVTRRASRINQTLMKGHTYHDIDEWFSILCDLHPVFHDTLKWISCFALAVNEENAAFGRVVTAPTNGAAGVIPAVIMYYACFCPDVDEPDIDRFLLVAGQIGSLFKQGATISAALGGCQAEIGVSSAMAAAALTECLGGTAEQALMAAEIAMEHHLGLTCDPVGGLVQVPCIERNTMGAIKAITASNIALESDPSMAKVTLDAVISTMWQTAQDMNNKYKETSEGGLAIHIPVNVAEC